MDCWIKAQGDKKTSVLGNILICLFPCFCRGQRNPASLPRSQHIQQIQAAFRPPSRTNSQNSMDSIKEGSISSSASGRSNTPVHDKEMRPPVEERVPPMHGHNPYGDRSFETNCPTTSGNSSEVFGTLPRWKTQKSQDHVRMCNNQKREDEVYQDFLDNQRRQTGVHSRTSSGAQTPVNDPDYVNSNLHQNSSQSYRHLQYQPGGETSYTEHPQVSGQTGLPLAPNVAPKLPLPSQHTEVGTSLQMVTNQQKVQNLCMHSSNLYTDPVNRNSFSNMNKTSTCPQTSQYNVINSQQNSPNFQNYPTNSISPVHTAYSYPVQSTTMVGQCVEVGEVPRGRATLTRNTRNSRTQELSTGQNSYNVARRPLARSTSFTKAAELRSRGTNNCKF